MDSQFEQKTLANGITLISKKIPGVAWQLCSFVVGAGAASDPKEKHGLAHFVEHMVSANHSMETVDIKNFFRGEGGGISLGSTGFLSTVYDFKLPDDEEIVRSGLKILKELLFDIVFTKNIERERKVIQSEYNTRFPVPSLKELNDHILGVLRRNTVIENRNRPLGDESAINSISYEDLQAFYDEYYHPSNVTVVSLGSHSLNEMEALLESSGFLESAKKGTVPEYRKNTEFEVPQENYFQYKISDYVSYSEQKQISTYDSYLRLPATANWFAAHGAMQMLSKKLFEEIREKHGLVYDTGAGATNFRIFLQLGIYAKNFDTAKLDVLKETIENVIRETSGDEKLFEFIKDATLKRMKMLDLNGHDQLEHAVDDLIYEEGVTDVAFRIKEVERVSFSDVREIFDMLKLENRFTVVELP